MPIPLLLSPSSTSSSGSSSSSAATLSPTTPVDDTMHDTVSLSSSPPASSKTHAFFTSSYVASPPPRPPPALRKRNSGESISSASSPKANDNKATTTTTEHPSSPTRSIFSPTSPGGFHISRIFPSRYTSTSRDADEAHDIEAAFSANRQRRKPQFLSLDSHPHDETLSDSIESALGYDYTSFSSYGPTHLPRESMLGLSDGLLPTPAYGYERDRGTGAEADAPPSSASSSTSSSSSHISIRLPTPPPPPPPLLTPSKDDCVSRTGDHPDADNSTLHPTYGSSDYTPRPSSYEPSIASMLRPFDPTPISKAPSMASTLSTAATEDSHDHLQEAPEAGELHEGDIIAPAAASSSSASSSGPSLRLLEPLGTGAFSAVWLAEDLSAIPLELASKKSVRDLKRHASLNSKGGLSRNSSVKSAPSRNGSIKGGSRNSVSRNSSLRKLKARLKGVKPVGIAKDLLDEFGVVGLGKADGRSSPSSHNKEGSSGSLDVNYSPSQGSSLSRNDSAKYKMRPGSGSSGSRLVAVKLTPRRSEPYSPQAEERTRVGFIREVEVLRHISHPNITPLLSSWTTPTHHVLVLPYLSGGDLLSLVNDDHSWNNLSEGVVRRIWCELCRGVAWMHSVGLVHRDVKLENVLLTWDGIKGLHAQEQVLDEDQPFYSSPPAIGQVPLPASPHHPRQTRVNVDDLPTPLIKLTDFGLSRFIDIGNGEKGQGELLTTRCGSEAYAAPELVMGSSSYAYSTPASSAALTPTVSPPSATTGPKHRSGYDARETDAWACGVVLYALVARKLPFGEGVGVDGVLGGGNTSHIGGERVAPRLHGHNLVTERRRWLMKIARGEWTWPDITPGVEDGEEELIGPQLVRSAGARRVVEKLLVRDPRKRARIGDLWEDEWMRGDAIGGAMYEWMLATRDEAFDGEVEAGVESMNLGVEGGEEVGEGEWEPLTVEDENVDEPMEFEDDEEGDEEEDDGWLLDEEGIGSIARQEVV